MDRKGAKIVQRACICSLPFSNNVNISYNKDTFVKIKKLTLISYAKPHSLFRFYQFFHNVFFLSQNPLHIVYYVPLNFSNLLTVPQTSLIFMSLTLSKSAC